MSDNTFGSSVFYKDPKAAIAWLDKAFGFEMVVLIEGPNGDDSQLHTEMKYSAGTISIGDRARSAGAIIVQEPTDEFRGDRRYRATDPEGHVWSFSQHIRDVSREQAERMTGHKIVGWPE